MLNSQGNVCKPFAKSCESPTLRPSEPRKALEIKAWRRKGPGGPTGLQNRPGGHCVRRKVRLLPPSATLILQDFHGFQAVP